MLSELVAQVDTSVVLDEYIIQAERIRKATIGSQSISFDENELDENINQDLPILLSEQAGLYIKGYGLGSLSTSSIRGGSAGHTVVLWNDVPLQSPLLGLLDLSLLAVTSFEEIKIDKGGQSAMWGSGAIGGVISLNNQQHQEDFSVQAHTNYGSFGQRLYDGELRFKTGNLVSQTTLQVKSANNDFTYLLSDRITERLQTNAELNQTMIKQDLYFTLNSKNQISLHYWYQNTDRHIPPTTVQTNSEAFQEDKANRLLLKWQRVSDNKSIHFKIATIHEELNYFDPAINLSSPSDFFNIVIDSDYQWNSSIGTIGLGASHFYTEANAQGYQDDIKENKSALFASYLYQKNKLQLQLNARQEWVDGENVPFIPSLGIQYDLSKIWQLKAKLSRNYRIPTLNDRFWIPGGNHELKAESGWSQEASINYYKDFENNKLHFSLTGYSRQINDWILWALLDQQAYFSANNIAKVWSRGIETTGTFTHPFTNGLFRLKAGYDYTKSTNEIALDQPSLDKGQQLIYTPVHQGFLNATFRWKKINTTYSHQFVGKASGINENIDRFHVSSIRLQTDIATLNNNNANVDMAFHFTIHNLFNKNYRVIERRPMPLRYYSVGVKLNFHK